MKNNKPLISVVMPVYNAEKFVDQAIQSILKQTFTDFEFIIIDDASTDSSWGIIQKYQKKYPQIIRSLHLEKNVNRGGDSCANIAIKMAKGKYIARMDADDISHPERLERQISILENDKTLFLVGANAEVIDQKGNIIGDKLEPLTHNEIKKAYFTFHPLIHPTVMFRRIVKINGKSKVFQYFTKYSANNDYYTFFTLLCSGKQFMNLEKKLLLYRIHGKNDTFVNVKKKFFNTLKIRIEIVKKYGYIPTFKQIVTTVIQTSLLTVLPEVVTIKLYLLAKGIITLQDIYDSTIENLHTLLDKVKSKFVLSFR